VDLVSLPPLSLYVHVPWCVRKCPYCDFNSHPVPGPIDETRYLEALLCDLEEDLAWVQDRALISVFIGGGTPSLLSAAAVQTLLSEVRCRIACVSELEVTLEANPGTVDAARFAGYRAAGVNRLSLGIQSFDADSLLRLGRIHGPGEAKAAVRVARQAGFINLNLDLMFGLPGQTWQQVERDLLTAFALEPEHLSYYQLTIEPNTGYAAAPPTLPDEDEIYALQEQARGLLAAAGYSQYEVSAYARDGKECRHNRNYWEFGDYLGIGCGAHSKVTDLDRGVVVRSWRPRHPSNYLRQRAGPGRVAGSRGLQPQDLLLEFLMNALRLNDGFPLDLFERRTGLGSQTLCEHLVELRDRGLIERVGRRVRATRFGRDHLNSVLESFLEARSC